MGSLLGRVLVRESLSCRWRDGSCVWARNGLLTRLPHLPGNCPAETGKQDSRFSQATREGKVRLETIPSCVEVVVAETLRRRSRAQ